MMAGKRILEKVLDRLKQEQGVMELVYCLDMLGVMLWLLTLVDYLDKRLRKR